MNGADALPAEQARVGHRGTFFRRLFLSYTVLVLTVSVIIGGLVLGGLDRGALREAEDGLFGVARLLASIEGANPSHLWSGSLTEELQQVASETDLEISLIRANGRLVATSTPALRELTPAAWLALPEIAAARVRGRGTGRHKSLARQPESLSIAAPIMIDYEIIGYTHVMQPLSLLAARRARLRDRVLFGTGINAVIALSVGFFFARNVTRPLGRIASVCRRLADGDLSARVRNRRNDEIGLVSDTVDFMAAEIHRRIELERREHERLAVLLAAMADGVIGISARGTIAYTNRVAAELLSLDLTRAIGQDVAKVLGGTAVYSIYRRGCCEQREQSEEIRIRAHPQDRVIQVYTTPLTDSHQGAFGTLIVLHDCTEIRRLEEMRRTFTANVSHELKTPLTAISAMIDVLAEDPGMSAKQRGHFLRRIDRQSKRLLELVQNLLTLSRIESTSDMLQLSPVEMGPIVQLAIETFQPIADGKGIRFLHDLDPDPLTVQADREALRLIVNNLVDNAINYTPVGGEVRLALRRAGATIVFEVSDTGLGIAQEHLERVWERFYRVDPARSREGGDRGGGGSGLGLAIVRHLCLAIGATVQVVSTVGTGSIFTLQLSED